MTTPQENKIRFLIQLELYTGFMSNLFSFLFEEKIVSKDQATEIKALADVKSRAQRLYLILSSDTDLLTLVDWEWQVLPTEVMKLTIVTRNMVKEFHHGL